MELGNRTDANVLDNADRASHRLIELVADIEQVDPGDLPPIGRTIDLEALDALIESANDTLMVEFTIHGYDVIVTGNGSVVLNSTSTR